MATARIQRRRRTRRDEGGRASGRDGGGCGAADCGGRLTAGPPRSGGHARGVLPQRAGHANSVHAGAESRSLPESALIFRPFCALMKSSTRLTYQRLCFSGTEAFIRHFMSLGYPFNRTNLAGARTRRHPRPGALPGSDRYQAASGGATHAAASARAPTESESPSSKPPVEDGGSRFVRLNGYPSHELSEKREVA